MKKIENIETLDTNLIIHDYYNNDRFKIQRKDITDFSYSPMSDVGYINFILPTDDGKKIAYVGNNCVTWSGETLVNFVIDYYVKIEILDFEGDIEKLLGLQTSDELCAAILANCNEYATFETHSSDNSFSPSSIDDFIQFCAHETLRFIGFVENPAYNPASGFGMMFENLISFRKFWFHMPACVVDDLRELAKGGTDNAV